VLSVGHGLVAGNIGPTGLFRPPVGTASTEELHGAFTDQAKALADGGVDYFSLETFSDLEEARIAMGAIRAVSDLPITACLTFDRKKRGFFTLMGDTPAKAFETLHAEGACAVGANCSVGSEDLLAGTAEMLDAAPVPLILKPNAGLPDIENGRAVYRQTAADFAADVGAMARQGAGAVGGCCGTDDHFIAALRAELDDGTKR
jgi:5-methyltetrahydrofolate--homocysteine methyltransferase